MTDSGAPRRSVGESVDGAESGVAERALEFREDVHHDVTDPPLARDSKPEDPRTT